MNALATQQKPQNRGVSNDAPHLSHSRVNKYLLCPEQFRLSYVEGLRPRVPDAALVFGKVIHQALEQHFRDGHDLIVTFARVWDGLRDVQLRYKERESWNILALRGRALLAKFFAEEDPRLGNVRAVEQEFSLTITSLGAPFVGVIDLVADLDGEPTVIDFKTSASSYQAYEVALSDQLTAYQLAEPEVTQTALCVFVKTKEPKIEWHTAWRQTGDLTDYLAKVEHIAGEIAAGIFFKRPGKWCSYCDFLPVCLGDEQTVHETLVQVAPT